MIDYNSKPVVDSVGYNRYSINNLNAPIGAEHVA